MEGNGIYTAMAEVMKDITAISKDKQCQQGGNFRYRGIDDVYNAINPLLGKYQIFVLPFCEGRNSEQRTTRNGGNVEVVTVNMKYSFCHADGSFVECRTIGEAMDSGDKATNKAMSAAFKYALFQVFCIPTEEMHDPDAETPEESQKAVICSVCGEPVKPLTGNRGKTYSPSEVLEKLGMCSDCYKVSQIAEGKK